MPQEVGGCAADVLVADYIPFANLTKDSSLLLLGERCATWRPPLEVLVGRVDVAHDVASLREAGRYDAVFTDAALTLEEHARVRSCANPNALFLFFGTRRLEVEKEGMHPAQGEAADVWWVYPSMHAPRFIVSLYDDAGMYFTLSVLSGDRRWLRFVFLLGRHVPGFLWCVRHFTGAYFYRARV